MGAWGYGIKQSDFVLEVIGAFDDLLKQGKSVDEATQALKTKYADELQDTDDGPDFWLAIADRQWTYGQLDPAVVQQIETDLHEGRSLQIWSDDPKDLKKRRAAIEAFLSRLAVPRPNPKKPPRIVIRPPRFAAGDCLSIRTDDGRFTAALVTVADHLDPEYGRNLIAPLDFLESELPELAVFERREWLLLTHHWYRGEPAAGWYFDAGFRKFKPRVSLIGRVTIDSPDPTTSNNYCGWPFLADQIVKQREWNASAGQLRIGQTLAEVEQLMGSAGHVVKVLPEHEARVFDPLGHLEEFYQGRSKHETIHPTDRWPIVIHFQSATGRVIRFRRGGEWVE